MKGDPKSCDTDLIELCASYAKRAYSENMDGIFIENKNTDTQCYLIVKNKQLIITGQGSTTVTDCLIDIQFWRTRVPYLKNLLVHSGFVKSYDSIRNEIHKLIQDIIETQNITEIICCGHSLFGAISTICALDIKMNYNLPTYCVTFGSPRVGSKKFAKLFNEIIDKSYRCVRLKDPISFTPMPGLYKHVSGGIHFAGNLHDALLNFKVPLYNPYGCKVQDHSIEDYLYFIHEVNLKKTALKFFKNNTEPEPESEPEPEPEPDYSYMNNIFNKIKLWF